jgi:hypothetical protein
MSDRIKVTITYEFDAEDSWYDATDLESKLEVETRNWTREGPFLVDQHWDKIYVKVEHVE